MKTVKQCENGAKVSIMHFSKIPNLLFSTTRSWNCGDDFILFGVRNLVKDIIPEFNSIIYNRNPELHSFRTYNSGIKMNVQTSQGQLQEIDLSKQLCGRTWLMDNSWRPQHDLSLIDYCIFAGTPEWLGTKVEPLVQCLIQDDTPVAYLGVGIFEGTRSAPFENLPRQDQVLLKKARLVTTRDADCLKLLEPVNAIQLPCPALFAADHERQRTEKQRIALSTQGTLPGNGQRIDQETLDYSVNLFRTLAELYNCTLVCHYIDEMYQLQPLLGDVIHIVYSYDAQDYIDLYDKFDLLVTTRVHGAGLCASLGIPSIVLSHSARSDTAAGFLADLVQIETVEVDGLVKQIAQLDIQERSKALLSHKEENRQRYLDLLEHFFDQPVR